MNAGPGAAWRGGLCWLAVFALLAGLADRDGYEGDDLDMVVPMLQWDAVQQGLLDGYRVAWQPLAYRLGAWLCAAAGTPRAVFLLAPLAASIALVLAAACLRRLGTPRWPWHRCLALLVLLPEVWWSGLYWNATILGMPFVLLALYLALGRPRAGLGCIAGALVAVAALCRVDWALAAPIVGAFVFARHGARAAVGCAAAALVVLAAAALAGVLDPAQIAAIHASSTAEMRDRSGEPGWDVRAKWMVLSVAMHPLGFVLTAVGLWVLVRENWRRRRRTIVLFAAAAAPLLLPARDLLSAKYLLPLMAVLPFAMRRIRGSALVVPVAAVVAACIAIEPAPAPPFVRVSALAARQVPTHDGPRSYGAYLLQAWRIAGAGADDPHRVASRDLVAFLRTPGRPVLLLGEPGFFAPGAIGWRHAQLALAKAGVRGAVVAPHTIRYELPERRFVLARDLANGRLALGAAADAAAVLDLRDPSLSREQAAAVVQAALASAR
jgi:hypothetical protein